MGNGMALGNGMVLGNGMALGNGMVLGNGMALGNGMVLDNRMAMDNGIKINLYVFIIPRATPGATASASIKNGRTLILTSPNSYIGVEHNVI